MSQQRVQLSSYAVALEAGARVLPATPAVGGGVDDIRRALEAALDAPIGCPPLESLVPRVGARVTLIVSDHTRHEPRDEMVAAVRARLPGARITEVVAVGTHVAPGELGDFVEVGITARGTPIRVRRCVVEADLVVATGCIRPHYFAGFAGGVKAIFPGLGEPAAIRINHRLKTHPLAHAGSVDENPCRLDLEEAVAAIPTPKFLVNVIAAPTDDEFLGAVAGDVVAAHRAGCARARSHFTLRASRSPHVIVSDVGVVTRTLYQAAKIAAAAAPLVAAGGVMTLVAGCEDGIGPGGFEVVNEAIFRIGVFPRLAPNVRVELLSSLDTATVQQTLLVSVSSTGAEPDSLVIPRASQWIYSVEA